MTGTMNEMLLNIEYTSLTRGLFKIARGLFKMALTAVFLLSTFFAGAHLRADDKKPNLNEDPVIQQEARDFIQRLADKALTSLHAQNKTLDQQETQFREILKEGFNVKYIGKISLGRHTQAV